DEQIAIYNYLYYYDKEEAEAYITLIQPYLGTKKAYEKYGEIKDSTFQKTMFEFGAGTESIFTGIENCFGGNDDLDGIPMQTVTSKVDGLIMSDAGTVESKIYGISKIGGALLPAAAVSVIPGAGGMAASGGIAAAYGLSAGGNAYAGAKQEGYTDYQSKIYGTTTGAKETAKMLAFAGVSKIIPANGSGSLLKDSLSIGAVDAGIEFADETLVTPNMSAEILDNPELKEVDYKEAALNSLATGGMFAGIHLVGGTVKNIGNKLQEKQTAGNKNCSEGLTDGTIADNVTKVEATKNITTESGNAKPTETGTETSRPTWRQSELDAAKDFPDYDAQKSFINGEEVPYGTKGSVRPDYYKDGYSVDIKNYNVESASGRSNLARNIEKQYYQRIENLPEGTKQSVMIDIRGQNVTDADLSALYDDIMKRTDNGVEILFKMD
ncbi:MAG: hypothetical protein U0K86_09930, partial [Agathobacter sp.]|nr:hypothetical protein [Agathobacter sp.]